MAVDTTDSLINAAVSRTSDLVAKASLYANTAEYVGWNYKRAVDRQTDPNAFGYGTAPSTAVSDFEAYEITTPITLPAPRPVYTENVDISTEFQRAFEDAFNMFHGDMLDGIAEYIGTWFPACVATRTDDWICNTILTGGQGIPADIEALIWMRARARESEEALKLEGEAVDQFASRGFTLPSGVLAARLLEVQQTAALKAGTLSRDIALKTFDAYREDVKFAVENGVKVRLGALSTLGDFIRAWTTPQGGAAEIAKAKVESKSRLVSTAADYYRAIVAEADLNLRAHQIMQSSHDQTISTRVTQDFNSERLGVDGASIAAQTYGQMAASASNSLVSLVGSEKQLLGSLA